MRTLLTIRAAASSLIRKHRWTPLAAVVLCASTFFAATIRGVHLSWELASAGALILTSYVYGYSARAFQRVNYPSLLHLPRRQYAEVWDALAATPELAKAAACGERDESTALSCAILGLHDSYYR